jgi:penicillin-insensitive murein DD-endopeptidase
LQAVELALILFFSSFLAFPSHAEDSPWLALNEGGIAIGHPQGKDPGFGSLQYGTVLPEAGVGYRRLGGPSINYGTGHMISLIEYAAKDMNDDFGTTLYVGGIAHENGGYFPPHQSHQNGLDADIAFVGQSGFKSVIEKNGDIAKNFDVEKNWELWRRLVNQRYTENGKTDSIVSMILVAPPIKEYLCNWATVNDKFQDPLNRELMSKIRPTAGHEGHFHMRIRCSPYHKECTRSWGPSKELGC